MDALNKYIAIFDLFFFFLSIFVLLDIKTLDLDSDSDPNYEYGSATPSQGSEVYLSFVSLFCRRVRPGTDLRMKLLVATRK